MLVCERLAIAHVYKSPELSRDKIASLWYELGWTLICILVMQSQFVHQVLELWNGAVRLQDLDGEREWSQIVASTNLAYDAVDIFLASSDRSGAGSGLLCRIVVGLPDLRNEQC